MNDNIHVCEYRSVTFLKMDLHMDTYLMHKLVMSTFFEECLATLAQEGQYYMPLGEQRRRCHE